MIVIFSLKSNISPVSISFQKFNFENIYIFRGTPKSAVYIPEFTRSDQTLMFHIMHIITATSFHVVIWITGLREKLVFFAFLFFSFFFTGFIQKCYPNNCKLTLLG